MLGGMYGQLPAERARLMIIPAVQLSMLNQSCWRMHGCSVAAAPNWACAGASCAAVGQVPSAGGTGGANRPSAYCLRMALWRSALLLWCGWLCHTPCASMTCKIKSGNVSCCMNLWSTIGVCCHNCSWLMTPSHLRTNSAEGPYRRVTVSDVTLHHSTAVCSHTATTIACSSAGRLNLHDQALVWTLLPLMQQVRRSVRHRCVVVRIATRAGGVDNARSNNKHTVLPKKLS
jgi:hypothetical protein